MESEGRVTQPGGSVSGCANLPLPFREIIFADPFTRVWCRLSPSRPLDAYLPFAFFQPSPFQRPRGSLLPRFFLRPLFNRVTFAPSFPLPLLSSFLSALLCSAGESTRLAGLKDADRRKPDGRSGAEQSRPRPIAISAQPQRRLARNRSRDRSSRFISPSRDQRPSLCPSVPGMAPIFASIPAWLRLNPRLNRRLYSTTRRVLERGTIGSLLPITRLGHVLPFGVAFNRRGVTELTRRRLCRLASRAVISYAFPAKREPPFARIRARKWLEQCARCWNTCLPGFAGARGNVA